MRKVLALVIAGTLCLGQVGMAAAEPGTYVVRAGDTLTAIAGRLDTTVAGLVDANNLSDPNFIWVGQSLVVPGGVSAAPATTNREPVPAAAPSAAPTRSMAHSPTSLLSKKRLLTYYGNPWASSMGILGELSKDGLVSELRRVANLYQSVSDKPFQPAIHLIATVAQASAGSDGMYRARMPASMIQEYSDLAEQNGMLLFIDIQFGRSTVQAEVAAVREFLTKPHVHLAIDPEFDMWGSDRPGVQLGHTNADEINHAIRVLADVVKANNLPNKILMVHQFTQSMLPDKQNIQNDPLVDIVIDMDGFGGQEIKTKHYEMFVGDEPVEYGAIKLFYRYDTNLMTPSQVMSLSPTPDVVIYQ